MRNCPILLIPLLLLVLALGCGDSSESGQPVVSTGIEATPQLFDIPPDAVIESATFHVYVMVPTGHDQQIHRGYDPWGEYTVNWFDYIDGWVPEVSGVFVADAVGWKSVDLTNLVQDWCDDLYPNYGFLIKQSGCGYPQAALASRESGAHAPYLEVCYYTNTGVACETYTAAADAYIFAAYPDDNFGDLSELLVGFIDECTPEAQSLIYFDIPCGHPDPASIGDFVWNDLNQDGIQDANEPGVEGVTVTLYDCAGYAILANTTDANGHYEFLDLTPGHYFVEIMLPDGWEFSPMNQGGDDQADSDVDPGDGRTTCTQLTSGENDMSWDAGIHYLTATIGDYVWTDLDKDGLQDAGEPGRSGVTVQLFDCADQLLLTTVTDGDGWYQFADLDPGDYYLQFVLPSGWVFSLGNQGANDALDSDANPGTGKTTCTQIVAGEYDDTWDAGMYLFVPEPGSLGDKVWYDGNLNGVQDPGEYGIAEVEVRLFNCDDLFMELTYTNDDGMYGFGPLDSGGYYVQFLLPDNYEFTIANAGLNDAKDSDAHLVSGRTDCTVILPGEVDYTWDAGMREKPCPLPAKLGDTVWFDQNQNGIQDPSEPGVANVQVFLLNCSGVLVSAAYTDADGFYLFDNLAPGGYMLNVLVPFGYEFSPVNQGGDDERDSDFNPYTGMTNCLSMQAGEIDYSIDCGLFEPEIPKASIGDRVWYDANRDGVQNPAEPGAEGVVVKLYNCAGGLLDETMTDANGNYLFDELNPGSYRVGVTPPDGYVFSPRNVGYNDSYDSDVDTASGLTTCVNLSPDEYDNTWDAGIFENVCPPTAALGDRVWYDADADGVQDPGEEGISGVTVTLYNCLGAPLFSTTTDYSGNYFFLELDPNEYEVGFTLPDGYVFSPAGVGADGTRDSDADQVSGLTTCVDLQTGEVRFDLDAGMYIPGNGGAVLGDRVWYDDDQDGIQDAGEPGIASVPVYLHDCDGWPIAETRTDHNGFWLFENLDHGEYFVIVRRPGGFAFSPQNSGFDDEVDSDVDPQTGATVCVWLTTGEIDRSWDAGLFESPFADDVHTIGYWKNHTGLGPQDDAVSVLLPQTLGDQGGSKSMTVTTVELAVDVLKMKLYGHSDNGITKLYAQLLATKFNMAVGAGDGAIDDVIADADAFLADHDWQDWDDLSSADKSQVLNWKDRCDRFNNGDTSPSEPSVP